MVLNLPLSRKLLVTWKTIGKMALDFGVPLVKPQGPASLQVGEPDSPADFCKAPEGKKKIIKLFTRKKLSHETEHELSIHHPQKFSQVRYWLSEEISTDDEQKQIIRLKVND